ncbi:glycosyltransferase (plasmid) [Deinococcus sp. KNUC1210]|uniref:glycosyltransferase n=1 Tax=Deinococcus sp. KNUC1210 TaxID=2917691 RepID=UPI001EEFF579|nr:glycosyltransferase [Deinococcus sp. KNUC1210]ULH17592.1 glycosyltransferase [Deinococcus sp. KNUC1210]
MSLPSSSLPRPEPGSSAPSSVRPKVLQVITSLNLGGAEEVALSLTERLHDTCDFSVFAVMGVSSSDIGRDMQWRLWKLGVPVHTGTSLDMKAGGAVVAGQRLRQLLRHQPPDVLHLHTDIPDSTYAASTLFGQDSPGLRVLRTIHNTTLWPKWRRIGGWVERRLTRAEVVGVSPESLESLHRFREAQHLPRLPAAQCRVVYNGVAGGMETAAQRPARPPGPVRILFAGRLEPQKGADLLPAILERAAQLTPWTPACRSTGTARSRLRCTAGPPRVACAGPSSSVPRFRSSPPASRSSTWC